jgi:hypothetical protein
MERRPVAGPAADYRVTRVRFLPLRFSWSVTHLERRLACHVNETGSIPVRTAVAESRSGSGGPCTRLKSGGSWFDSRGRHMREELEWSSVGLTHRRSGFDSLLAHMGP